MKERGRVEPHSKFERVFVTGMHSIDNLRSPAAVPKGPRKLGHPTIEPSQGTRCQIQRAAATQHAYVTRLSSFVHAYVAVVDI